MYAKGRSVLIATRKGDQFVVGEDTYTIVDENDQRIHLSKNLPADWWGADIIVLWKKEKDFVLVNIRSGNKKVQGSEKPSVFHCDGNCKVH